MIKQNKARMTFKTTAVNLGLACAFVFSPLVQAQSVAPTATASTAADDSVTMVIRKGHNVREIAKRYSRANNVPFQKTLDGLIAANPNAFANGNPDVLIIGAPFVLPNRETLLAGVQPVEKADAANSNAAPPAEPPKETNAASATDPEKPKADNATPVTPPAVTSVASAPVTAIATEASAPTQLNWDSKLPIPIWLLGLIGVALLMLLIRVLRRKPKQAAADLDEDADKTTAQLTPPRVNIQLPSSSTPAESSTPAVKAAEVETPSNVSNIQLENVEISVVEVEPADAQAFVKSAFAHVDVSKYGIPKVNLPLNTERGVPQNITQNTVAAPAPETVVEVAQTVVATVVPVEPDVPDAPAPLSKGLDLDVSGFMQRYASQVTPVFPAPFRPSVDFEDLLDRTHLQAWLNQRTPEEVLLHAQEAHDAGYDEIAQNMLADVLFRGDAEQCALAARLRKEWSAHGYS